MRHGVALISVAVAIWFALSAHPAIAQVEGYRPLGSWSDPDAEAVARWSAGLNEAARKAKDHAFVSSGSQVASLRSHNHALLEDALIRRHRGLQESPARVSTHIQRLYRHQPGRNVLNGAMAEALYFDKNPEYSYVRRSNAPQHDGYRRRLGLPPENVQIKFHKNGSPAEYARDMVRDHRAHRFAVPDDHVAPLKDYLRRLAQKRDAANDAIGTKTAWRNFGRVKPIGASSAEILSATRSAPQQARLERYGGYTSLGAAIALSIGPTVWDAANGSIRANTAMYQATRSLSILGIGRGTEFSIGAMGRGALRGTTRGNVIVASAKIAAEVAWLIYEHGGTKGVYQPELYDQVGGDVGTVTLGIWGFKAGTFFASGTGPWAPVIGTGVAIATGTVGYLGGRAVTHTAIEVFAPELLRQQEKKRIEIVKDGVAQSISKAQRWSAESL